MSGIGWENDDITWRLTPQLRFAVPPYTSAGSPVLQQAWACDQDGTIHWLDVPFVVVEP